MNEMPTSRWSRFAARAVLGLAGLGIALGASACGGGGGSSTGDTLKGVVLVDFLQSGQDNVPLNRTLEFRFSAPIDPNSVNPDSIQIRQGTLFGAQVFGKFIVQGSTIYFEPKLPGLCDLSDSGFQPNNDYRVTLVGSPEEFAIRSLAGDPLKATISAVFHTRPETDPELFEDQIPGIAPTVISTSPENGAYPQAPPAISAPVMVFQGNKITIDFSENLSPCTVSESTVLVYQWAHGDPVLGFQPNSDQAPSSPTSWGSGNADTPARRVRSNFSLSQDQLTTRLTITPVFGEFPDNALLVVEVTNNVKDFGSNALVPYTFSFVTENRPVQTNKKAFQFNGDFPADLTLTTGDDNTARSPSKVQGWLLFAGDGDNGANPYALSGPDTSNGPSGCTSAGSQANNANPDDFDPPADVNISTGASLNTCKNSTDGSKAVVFEYRTFRIRNGVTVRFTGVNAAIILVSGDITIEATGRLLARGDGGNGNVQSNGTQGTGGTANKAAGGVSVAGGGNGGEANNAYPWSTAIYGQNGTAGLGSVDAYLTPGYGGTADPVRQGAGRGGVGTSGGATVPTSKIAPGGGGGGHATAGANGENNGAASANTIMMNSFVDGVGGSTYGDLTGKMKTPEAGSGGAGGGTHVWNSSSGWNAVGGAGGGGGGFVDLTSAGNITILGTIDAAGGKGSNGTNGYNYATGFAYYGGGGGGGGGSGGGIRILTPNKLVLGSTTLMTTAGGAAGSSGNYAASGAVTNRGGAGGIGRIALEDGDSVIGNIAAATLVPAEGAAAGFYKGVFDATRFQGGGLQPVVVTTLIDMGPRSPTYLAPDQNYLGTPVPAPGTPRVDFLAGIPAIASRGLGKTGILIEMQGFAANPDGTPASLGTGWKAIGYFTDSGAEAFPNWTLGLPPGGDVTPPAGNTGAGIAALAGSQFVQFRITFYLRNGMGPFDPGPYIDSWDLYFQYNQ